MVPGMWRRGAWLVLAALPAVAWLEPPDVRSLVDGLDADGRALAVPPGVTTVAVIESHDDLTAEVRLAAYRSIKGLAPCTTANGCFAKVNQAGAASPLPAVNPTLDRAVARDLERASAACPSCSILVVEAASSDMTDLAEAHRAAARRGAVVVSEGDEVALAR